MKARQERGEQIYIVMDSEKEGEELMQREYVYWGRMAPEAEELQGVLKEIVPSSQAIGPV